MKKMNSIDIIKQIEKLCGKTTLLENGWHHFVYNHFHYVNIPDCKSGMIRFSIPHICSAYEYERGRIDTIINETNREVKYIKVMILKNGSISINYDHKITEGEKAGDIVPHMIKTLYGASEYLVLKLKKTTKINKKDSKHGDALCIFIINRQMFHS